MFVAPTNTAVITDLGSVKNGNEFSSMQANSKPINDTSLKVNEPYGNTPRGLFSSWFNARDVAKEDFIRDDQLNQLQFKRESEWQEKMANTAYQRTVEDLKKAGLNPILAYDNAPTQSFSAPSSTGRKGKSGSDGSDALITGLAKIIAGLLTKKISYN